MQSIHPDLETLTLFSQGGLPPEEIEKVRRHLVDCAECCETLDKLPEDSLLQLVRDSGCAQTAMLGDDPTSDELENDAANDVSPQTVSELTTPAELLPQLPAELHQHSRYVVLERIGTGGMGNVFRAQHRLMDRSVAIKVINRELVNHRHAAERFRREVRAAAALTHANIVAALDAEQEGDLHFLVMEHVDGQTLFELVSKEGPLPIARACNYVRQASLGLAHAHERGLVHRDIKPQNLMLTKDGTVKVLDFGLASLMEATPHGIAPNQPSELTHAGAVMGTPDYISPEQANDASQADIRSDLYSLGGTLYFLLTGQPPFVEGDVMDKLHAHAEKSPPAVDSVRIDIPGELAAVVRRLMAKHPADRFQTPAELAEALAPFVDRYRPQDKERHQKSPKRQSDRRHSNENVHAQKKSSSFGRGVLVMGLLSVGMLVTACLIAVMIVSYVASRREYSRHGELHERMNEQSHQAQPKAQSEEGGGINFPASTSTTVTIYTVETKFPGIELVRVEDKASMSFPSARGMLENDYGGQPARRAQIRVSRGTWLVKMKDEKSEFIVEPATFVATHGSRVTLTIKRRYPVNIDDLNEQKNRGLTPALRQIRHLTAHRSAITGISVDSNRNVFVSASSDGAVYIWNLAAGLSEHRHREPATPGNTPVDINDDGTKVVVGDRGGRFDFYEVKSGKASNVIDLKFDQLKRVAFSPDGSIVLGVDSQGKLACCNFDLTPFPGPGKIQDAHFSADGKLIYVVSDNLHILNVNTNKWIEEINLKTRCSRICIAKDGKHIAVGSETGSVYLFEVGEEEPKYTLDHHTDGITDMAFSADGALLATGGYDQKLIVWDTAQGLELTRAVNSRPIFNTIAFSADGRILTGGNELKSASNEFGNEEFKIYEWDLAPVSTDSDDRGFRSR